MREFEAGGAKNAMTAGKWHNTMFSAQFRVVAPLMIFYCFVWMPLKAAVHKWPGKDYFCHYDLNAKSSTEYPQKDKMLVRKNKKQPYIYIYIYI